MGHGSEHGGVSQFDLIKLPNGDLRPATDDGRDKVKRWKVGDVVVCEVRRPRSQKFHRLYFGLLNMVYENSEWCEETWPKFERFREAVQMQAGHFEETKSIRGNTMYRAASIAFHKMDDDQFHELFNRVVDIVINHVPEYAGVSPDELVDMVMEYQRQ